MQSFSSFHVIASEAKQSIFPSKERMDCFVASLLAMTGGTFPLPRNGVRQGFLPPNKLRITAAATAS